MHETADLDRGSEPPAGMVWVPGATFTMGSAEDGYPEEHPPHPVRVDGFWMDEAPVTVERWSAFVCATGYKSVAEQPLDPAEYPQLDRTLLDPGSLVFAPPSGPIELSNHLTWWSWVPGACWSAPDGPASTVAGRERHPVTHVAWDDVAAYAVWAGKQLPSEAEWERAARGGLEGARFAWGDEAEPDGVRLANTWLGEFPWKDDKPIGLPRTSPVGSFPANGFGLLDVTGNVWEWTADFWRDHHSEATGACCAPTNPRVASSDGSHDHWEPGGAHIPRRVVKGGSHLCAPNYCLRYRPAARQPQPVDSSMSHLGFRCILRPITPQSDTSTGSSTGAASKAPSLHVQRPPT